MTDRLSEIERAVEGGKMAAGLITVLDTEKADWLIAEIKRLREEIKAWEIRAEQLYEY